MNWNTPTNMTTSTVYVRNVHKNNATYRDKKVNRDLKQKAIVY